MKIQLDNNGDFIYIPLKKTLYIYRPILVKELMYLKRYYKNIEIIDRRKRKYEKVFIDPVMYY